MGEVETEAIPTGLLDDIEDVLEYRTEVGDGEGESYNDDDVIDVLRRLRIARGKKAW